MRSHPNFLWKDVFRRKTPEQASRLGALRENVLFRTLTERELRHLSPFLYDRVYQPGEPVFHQNDRGMGMYIIVKGRVAIKTQAHHGETLITVLGEGSFFGELSLIDPNNLRSASAEALDHAILVGFFKPDLLELMERKPATASKILFQLSTVLGRRLLETTDRITLISRARGISEVHEDVI